MMRFSFLRFVILISVLCLIFTTVSAQQNDLPQTQSQEVSEVDGIPVIIKHLPDWENARNSATFITNSDELRKALGERPIFDSIEFVGGTEAVTAPYPQGKLLIVEYTTPQASVDTDNNVKQIFAESAPNPPVFYRRIGNYNVFLFDGNDETCGKRVI